MMNTTLRLLGLCRTALPAGLLATALGWTAVMPAQAYTFGADSDGYGLDFELDGAGNPIKVGNGVRRDGDGDLIGSQWSSLGVSISETSGKNLLLFNSNCDGNGSTQFGVSCTGNDPDLATGSEFGTDPQGNVLIIQETNRLWRPDDDARGGTISFDFFDGLVDLKTIGLLDLEDGNPDLTGVSFKAWFGDGSSQDYSTADLAYTNLANRTGDNSLYEFDLSSLLGVSKFDVQYAGSGAIAYFDWARSEPPNEVPEPMTMVGLLAVGALGLTIRRQSAES